MAAEQQRLGEELKHTGEQLTAARVELGQMQEKQLASSSTCSADRRQSGTGRSRSSASASSAESVAARQGGVEAELESAARRRGGPRGKQAGACPNRSAALVGQVAEAGEAVRTLAGQVEALRESHAEVEQQLHALDLKQGETRVRLESLVSARSKNCSSILPAKYADLSAPAEDGTPGAGYQPADMDWDAVADEIKELREKIQRLGNVNLDAIGELDELEQRQTVPLDAGDRPDRPASSSSKS